MLIAEPPSSADASGNPPSEIFPALASLYRDRGYEIGYSRAVSDVFASFFEVTEQFAQSRPADAAQIRSLLHAFSRHLEEHIAQHRQTPARDAFFEHGSGI